MNHCSPLAYWAATRRRSSVCYDTVIRYATFPVLVFSSPSSSPSLAKLAAETGRSSLLLFPPTQHAAKGCLSSHAASLRRSRRSSSKHPHSSRTDSADKQMKNVHPLSYEHPKLIRPVLPRQTSSRSTAYASRLLAETPDHQSTKAIVSDFDMFQHAQRRYGTVVDRTTPKKQTKKREKKSRNNFPSNFLDLNEQIGFFAVLTINQ